MEFTTSTPPQHFDQKIIEMLKNDQYIQAVKYVKDKNPNIDLATAKEKVDYIRDELIKDEVKLPEHKAGCSSIIIIVAVISAALVLF